MGVLLPSVGAAPTRVRSTNGGPERSPRAGRVPTRRRLLLSVTFLLIVAIVAANDRWMPDGPLQTFISSLALAVWASAIAWALWDAARR